MGNTASKKTPTSSISDSRLAEYNPTTQGASNAGTTSVSPNSSIQVGQMHSGIQSNQVAYDNIYSGSASGQHSTFNNQENQGRLVGGTVTGGTVNQGDTYNHSRIFVLQRGCNAYPHEIRQTPSASSSISSQPSAEDWQQKLVTTQQSLKETYRTRFQKVYPFSLPFTFDIENTWVSLALKEEKKDSQVTEDHAELLKRAFDRVKMLIIEGDPATGKTSLMRRLAYEWANGKQELLHYDLVLYAEFREVREKTFQSIADLVLGGLAKYLDVKDLEIVGLLLNDKEFCQQNNILVLLDGYDESSSVKQCSGLSSYLTEKTIKKALFFNTVITTRKGPLSNCRDLKGRYIFAEVLGFTTKKQKKKYVYNHFLSSEINNKHNGAAVHQLLDGNKNLDKLAETPLFLTFICLVHERIVDGTLVELYCSIIWWLIDRHQQDFPEREVPSDFGFQNGSDDKFEIIQEHYLHFPQLHCLGKMALQNLKKDIFEYSDYEKYNLLPIIEQVGLLRKEKKHENSFKLVSTFHFPHRTIQEFLAAFYCFCSNDPTSDWLLPNSTLDTPEMNEFEIFLLRIALSDKMPIQAKKRKYYFEKVAKIYLNTTLDAFTTTTGFNNKLLTWFLSQCTNVQNIALDGKLNSARHARNMLNDAFMHDEPIVTYNMSSPTLFSFSDLKKVQSLWFWGCTFKDNTQLSFTNCPSLKYLLFNQCKIESSTILGIAILSAIETLVFEECTFETDSQLSFTDCPYLKNLKFSQCGIISSIVLNIAPAIDAVEFDTCIFKGNTQLSFTNCPSLKHLLFNECKIESSAILGIATLSAIETVEFRDCTFEVESQLSITNCPTLKNLLFIRWKIESSTNLGIATLPAIDTVEFSYCKTDLATWQTILNQIRNRSVKSLNFTFDGDFNKEILIHLQECDNIEKVKITIWKYRIPPNEQLSFTDLMNLHSVIFRECTISANSQLIIKNCPSLHELKFNSMWNN